MRKGRSISIDCNHSVSTIDPAHYLLQWVSCKIQLVGLHGGRGAGGDLKGVEEM